jgi:hypothetical protein
MESNEETKKLNGILEAITEGRSCEQILAADRSLCYHDIFHALAEAPTTFWDKAPDQRPQKGSSRPANSQRTPAKQRAD